MKHSKFITWLAAAALGVCAAAFSAGLTAEAATGTCSVNGIDYSYDTDALTAKVTGCSASLTSITIPAAINPSTVNSQLPDAQLSVTEIDSYSLWNYTGKKHYTSVSLPSTLQRVGEYAFAYTELKSITLPSNVTFVGNFAFANCESLKTVKITGATQLNIYAFSDCPELTNVQVSANSFTKRNWEAFVNCPKLTKVNGKTVVSYQTVNGHQYPVLNPAVSTAIRNHFSRSLNVKFVNDYCTALCNYIVETETDPWMCDALKARQLHDWLVRHCEYEDCNGSERLDDSENQIASSVFLSYGLNVRGEGIGETVCAGFTKAYTMLLSAAGIESYPVEAYQGPNNTGTGHAWNLVKINNGYRETYYETDVTWDNHTNGTQYGTMYTHFFKNHAEMQALHDTQIHLQPPTLWGCGSEHPLLRVYTTTKDAVQTIMANATESFKDNNHDGIYDDDFDLSGGYMNSTDWTAYYECLRFLYGDDTSEQLSKKLPEVFYYLHQRHMSFWEYLASYGPSSQTVHAGDTAHFSVNLFGDGLTYQWKYWDNGHWVAVDDPSATTSELSFTATPEMNGRYIICFLRNKDNVLFYPDFVLLTVI